MPRWSLILDQISHSRLDHCSERLNRSRQSKEGFPTVMEILNLDVPDKVTPIDGISLLRLIDKKMAQRPKPIPFWYYPSRRERGNELYVGPEAQTGTWRTFRNYKHPKPQDPEEIGGHAALIDNRYKLHEIDEDLELYDIVNDPAETTDLSDDRPEIVARLKATLDAWQESVELSLSGRDYRD